jgi:glyoxylase-like metal-dependent hydrolase (beta-lactamase superfamily II)
MLDSTDFTPGRPVVLAPGIVRIVAPNASMMTGPGTNTYLLGDPVRAIVDPGPDDARHLAAVLAAAPRPDLIFATHTHRDHSPLAAKLAALTGARLVGRPPPGDERQDRSFVPDAVPARDERWAIGSQSLRAIDTPGHASNHVCYLLEEQGLLFSGDHILDGVTPVILAPDGDMAAYLESLARLRTEPLAAIAPGHGRVLRRPFATIDQIVAHRARREQQVVEVLARHGPATTEAMVGIVYAGFEPALLQFARFTLEAHLIKLERESRARRERDTWHAV